MTARRPYVDLYIRPRSGRHTHSIRLKIPRSLSRVSVERCSLLRLLLFAQHDLAHWRKTLDGAAIICVLVGRVDGIRHDEQVLAAGYLRAPRRRAAPVDDRQPV